MLEWLGHAVRINQTKVAINFFEVSQEVEEN
jgi:hypothetical protein